MRDANGFRQQLSTTSFEAFELEITVNYPVHAWTENSSFMRNLTSWSVPFWLVLLTEHKVLHCYATNVVCRCMVAGHYCIPVLWIPNQTVDASNFLTIVRKFTQRPSCTIPFWQIEILNQNLMHLSMKFSWFCLIFTDINFRFRQFPKVK